MTLDEVLLGVKNQSNLDISCSHLYKQYFWVTPDNMYIMNGITPNPYAIDLLFLLAVALYLLRAVPPAGNACR